MTYSTGPTSHFFISQRLRQHYVDWGNDGAPILVLVHGGRDHCRSWDWIAERFRDTYHVIAPDLRGHGESDWSLGGGYTIADHIYDLRQLLRQRTDDPVSIISHSLGGHISLLYAGLFPERVSHLVAIEGTFILQYPSKPVTERMTSWIDRLVDLSGRQARRYASIETAFRRMQEENPRLTAERARHLTVHGVNQNEDGTFSWKYDNYMRPASPNPFTLAEITELWNRITCPTLLVYGGESGAKVPDIQGDQAYFKAAQTHTIKGAGHWVHHDREEEFAALARTFLETAQ